MGFLCRVALGLLGLLLSGSSGSAFDVRVFGAVGDGTTLDTKAINDAIAAAHKAGGGTVRFPPGIYASFTIRLLSNVTLEIGPGATLLAAEPPADLDLGYDTPEPSDVDQFVDFGHAHFRNSLIWGENLENVSIQGSGRIFGRGLSKGVGIRDLLPEERLKGLSEPIPEQGGESFTDIVSGPFGFPNSNNRLAAGIGNKAIALKNGRNVVLRDITIYHGGTFAILAKGIDGLTIDNLTIDTNRDGIDLDVCRNVRISNCIVNAPFDDAIVLKSSYALGAVRSMENVTISNCQVSGYEEGTLLDGTYMRSDRQGPRHGPMGRIKLGTESNGAFKNIVISNCTFDYSRGLALEVVDGGSLEDVSITNLVMREIGNSPIFLRLGNRGRGPGGLDSEGFPRTPVGTMRRVKINQVTASCTTTAQGILVDGLPQHPIEDVSLSDVLIVLPGGGTEEQARLVIPEMPQVYPEPQRWGVLPAWGLWARHVSNFRLRNVELRSTAADARPAVVFDDAREVILDQMIVDRAPGAPGLILRTVTNLTAYRSVGIPEIEGHSAARDEVY